MEHPPISYLGHGTFPASNGLHPVPEISKEHNVLAANQESRGENTLRGQLFGELLLHKGQQTSATKGTTPTAIIFWCENPAEPVRVPVLLVYMIGSCVNIHF